MTRARLSPRGRSGATPSAAAARPCSAVVDDCSPGSRWLSSRAWDSRRARSGYVIARARRPHWHRRPTSRRAVQVRSCPRRNLSFHRLDRSRRACPLRPRSCRPPAHLRRRRRGRSSAPTRPVPPVPGPSRPHRASEPGAWLRHSAGRTGGPGHVGCTLPARAGRRRTHDTCNSCNSRKRSAPRAHRSAGACPHELARPRGRSARAACAGRPAAVLERGTDQDAAPLVRQGGHHAGRAEVRGARGPHRHVRSGRHAMG